MKVPVIGRVWAKALMPAQNNNIVESRILDMTSGLWTDKSVVEEQELVLDRIEPIRPVVSSRS